MADRCPAWQNDAPNGLNLAPGMAAGYYSTPAVSMGHLALKRANRHTEASYLVSRNVAVLTDTPKARKDGRPSR